MVSERWHLFFRGHVQGVGFRYTALSVATRLQVVGWIRNLKDGRVESVIEATPTQLQEFVDELSGSTHGNVAEVQKTKCAASNEFDSFQIVRE
jgi:acylphosphatase